MHGTDKAIENTKNGYDRVIDMLRQENVQICAGITGGPVKPFLRHLRAYCAKVGSSGSPLDIPLFFNLSEYSAGFVPLGSFLANGKIGACISTTGAATKLLTCGMTDAKFHNIPAIYMTAVTSQSSDDKCPLQDTSEYGSNILAQLRAELPESVFLLNNPSIVGKYLFLAREKIRQSKPVVLVLVHEALCLPAPPYHPHKMITVPDSEILRKSFITEFAVHIKNCRVTLLAGEELTRISSAATLITRVCELLGAAVVWSINGINAVARDNPWGYGGIGFGGNDTAVELWESLGDDDVLMVLGACPDEYTLNLEKYPAGKVFVLTSITDSYGQINGSTRHRAEKDYYELTVSSLEEILSDIIQHFENTPPDNVRMAQAPAELNFLARKKPESGCVDIFKLYETLDRTWPSGTVIFDDTCLSYKDRQYVTQRPNPNVRSFSLYRNSSMGNTLGVTIGAKLAEPEKLIVAFTGDGCFRLFGGHLADAGNLGIILFVLDNEGYGLIAQTDYVVTQNLEQEFSNTNLPAMDFCAIATASGWKSFNLQEDLGNIDDIFNQYYLEPKRSVLVRVPIDKCQIVGLNNRWAHLYKKFMVLSH